MSYFRILSLALCALAATSSNSRSEVIIQFFETRWDEMYQRLPEVAETGYESIWTPPPGKSPIGGPHPYAYGGNVGYNSFDRFDLGDQPQRGHWETRYGSRTSLRQLVDNAHQLDMKIYPDIVFNHTGNGPDFRTYPGMVPQDFHVWADASQPGGFKRAERMWQWDANNGTGGTLHQELVSLMDIVLEFDNRFQVGGANSVGYAADPVPFVRHPGDYEKYPYHNPGDTLPDENSRDFVVRWINWLGYAMNYDGVRLDAPKHVYKDFFGMPNQNPSIRDKTLIYNIQKNFNERRGFTDADPFDDMYSNDIRRDDALVYSEFFIGGVGEVDYWRNPSDPNWGIKTRYLDFPRKKSMMNDAFNNGNLAALSGFSGFSPEEGVMFAHSHDEGPPAKLELAYAYVLTRVGVPVVYFSGNNLRQDQIGRVPGKNTWMEKGYDYALGDTVNGFRSTAIPNLVYIHNQFARGREYTRWSENDFFAFERYEDLNGNGQPNSGEGLLLVALNDSGWDQTKSGIQTAFAPGTKLKDYTGRNGDIVTVNGSGQVTIRVPGGSGQGFVCYAPFNAEGPDGVDPLQFSGSGVTSMPWVVPAGRDAAAKPARNVVRISGDTVQIDVRYSNAGPQQNGETVDNVLLKWGKGENINGNAGIDFNGKDVVTGGFESMEKIADGHYRVTANIANIPEGLHSIKARAFNGRTGKPALFQTFTETVYVDRRGPDLEFENLADDETIHGARVVTINNPDRTLYNLTYSIDGGPAQQADEIIKGKWRINLDGLASGNHTVTLNATEADYGSTRNVINASTTSRNFTVDTAGSTIAINHANNVTLTEPFFKTTVTVPAGTSAGNVKLYWNGYEQILTEATAGSGVFESYFDGRHKTGGVDRLFTGAFVNGPHFFEAVVNPGTANENRVSRRVVYNLYGRNMHDSDGDGIPDEIELSGFLDGTNPGPDVPWPGDNSRDLIPNFGENWTRLNAMAADTDYVGTWDGDVDSDGDGKTNLQEVIAGYRLAGNPYQYNIYAGNSTPPDSSVSNASSTLTVVGGVKTVNITYRPNEGPLQGVSQVYVRIVPTGGGSTQSYLMTESSPGVYTYAYAVPTDVTGLTYAFANAASSPAATDDTGAASWTASTTAGFTMDGGFDSPNFKVSDNGMVIYAAVRGNKLYAATWSNKASGNDHFIFITDEFGNPVSHPWAKAGRIFGKFDFSQTTKPWIGANPDNAYPVGFGTSGRNWLGNGGQALETEIDLVEVFGQVPRIIYIAVGAYPRADGAELIAEAPASWDGDNDFGVMEFQALNTASIRDENLDGWFDVGAPEMVTVVNNNDADGNYGLRRFYLNELLKDSSEITVKFKPNTNPDAIVSNVEAFTNLNRRDFAVLEENPSLVTTASTDTYFRAYPMTGPDADGYYTTTIPVNRCGAYRLQVRYKVNGGEYVYYTDHAQRRDCAVVVSPKKALTANMYEVNPLIVEAKDNTFEGRSTFQDLVEGGTAGVNRFGGPDALNRQHYESLGVNMLWLQPIHPIGVDGRDTDPETDEPFNPGSPYAVQDYWSVAPMLARNNTASGAMAEFQGFVSDLDAWGVDVMMDGTFNHSAPDVIMGQGAADLGFGYDKNAEIREANYRWYAKEGFPAQQATGLSDIAIAPDRNDFGNWTDVREFYFGNYDTLVKAKGTQNPDKSYPDNAHKFEFLLERDEFFGHTPETRQVWEYFAYYPIYWLERSGHPRGTSKEQSYKGIDGLRCDFAQGLPSQFWEYCINRTRSVKWDFLFMAESLDGFREVAGSLRHGVGYRSARHFDILNENIVFYWRDSFFGYDPNGNNPGRQGNFSTGETFVAYDRRRQAFDNVTLLNNLVSHDEVFPHNDVWSLAYAYAQTAAMDGIPMILYGQEAGAQNSATGYAASTGIFGPINSARNFGKYELNFGKRIPNFKVYNNMKSIWESRGLDSGLGWNVQGFYGAVNKARAASPALKSQNVYFLNLLRQGGGFENSMLAVGKVQQPGVSAGQQDVVFAFVNNNHRGNAAPAGVFDLRGTAPGGSANYFGIERQKTYNIRDLLAADPDAYVWDQPKTGAELLDAGLYVGLPYQGKHAQFLKLVDLGSNYTDTNGNGTPDVLDPDIDGDGMTNEYELAHGLNPNDASDRERDDDADGFSNHVEFVAGTAANDSRSALQIVNLQPGQSETTVSFQSTPGAVYRVRYAYDLTQPWNNVAGGLITADTAQTEVTISTPPTADKAFYTIQLVP